MDIFKFSTLFILLLILGSITAFGQTIKTLVPEGEKKFHKLMNDYPVFNEGKIKKKAEQKFKIIKRGDTVTLTIRGKKVKGTFMGISGRIIILDDNKISLLDVPPNELKIFDKEEIQRKRRLFIDRAREQYLTDKAKYASEQRAKLYLKYPHIDNAALTKLFSKVKDKNKREQFITELTSEYNQGLPLKEKRSDFTSKLFEKFLKTHPELVLDKGYVRIKNNQEKEAQRKLILEKQRAERLLERKFRPKTASPQIKPSGGLITPGELITITCSTKDAEIHYTTDGSHPDKDSPLYKAPFPVLTCGVIKAIAFHPTFNDSDIVVSSPWTGCGLYASFFAKKDFTGKTSSMNVDKLDFDCVDKSPAPQIPTDSFSAIWTGSLLPPETGEYTFYISSDGASRLWLNQKLLIDTDNGLIPEDNHVKINLTGNKLYDMKIAYVESIGPAALKLEWKGPGIRRQLIETKYLFTEGTSTYKLKLWNEKKEGFFNNRFPRDNPALHKDTLPEIKTGKVFN